MLAETDASGNVARYYVYGAMGELVSAIDSTGNEYWYHYDHIGNTLALTDTSGNIVNRYAYEPFGRLAGQGETVSNPFKYVGQWGVMEEGNDLYYMRARYYDSNLGRFLTRDPIGFYGGNVNLYAYVANNPVNFIDPEGLKFKTAADAIRKLLRDIDIEGRKGTRICQIRYKKKPIARLDYGPYEGTHREPRLHGHLPTIWPDWHIPLDPRSLSD